MAENLWKIKFGEEEYELLTQDLTVARLRQMKQWFGGEYGRFLPFLNLLMQGDADACCCALWIVKTKAGEKNVKEPRFMDFAVSDFFLQDETSESEDDDPPTEVVPIRASKKTSKG